MFDQPLKELACLEDRRRAAERAKGMPGGYTGTEGSRRAATED